MFLLVYFSIEVCLVGVFPHSVSTRRDPCVRVYAPFTPHAERQPLPHPPPPSRENKIEQGRPGSPLAPSEGVFELTHGSACIIGLYSGFLDNLISTYITQFIGCVISRIHYGLKLVFYFRHFTVFHYHHYSRLIAGTEHI